MARSLLITQCLQHDFVAPIEPDAPLPNKLHVGWQESRRLLGVDPRTGPVAQVMGWARRQDPEVFSVAHIRDWHDPDDSMQADHLATFGPHCLAGSEGASLVLGLDDEVAERPNERHFDAIGLNDLEVRDLADHIMALKREAGGKLRVGVVGVWTEAKVTFLLYDLKTRCGIDDLATCSALTASNSRAQHFNAIDQLRKLLSVEVFDSVGEFTRWLVPDSKVGMAQLDRPSFRPEIRGAEVSESDADILAYLYRESSRVDLAPLSGGFSGAAVYRVTSHDALGHRQAPSVAKLGPRKLVGNERAAFERVEPILGNDAPSVKGFVDLGERAGLKYAFASMGDGPVTTFKSAYEDGADLATVESLLDTTFGDILDRFYAAAHYESLPLLDYYGFSARHANGVRANLERLGIADTPEGRRLVDFYATDLARLRRSPDEYHYVSYVHGDLNGANILIDSRDNVWLIDFFHAKRGHVLQDLAKLENDLLYIFTPVDEQTLPQARVITDALARVADLRAPLADQAPAEVSEPALLRAWSTLGVIRRHVAQACRDDRDSRQYQIAALRYSAHTLAFDESSHHQKLWAAHASHAWACGIA